MLTHITSESDQDWADRFGKRVSVVVVVCLGALFAYGYLPTFIHG